MKTLLVTVLFALPLSGMQTKSSLKQYTESASIASSITASLCIGTAAVGATAFLPVVATGALAGVGARFLYNQAVQSYKNSNDQLLKDIREIQ